MLHYKGILVTIDKILATTFNVTTPINFVVNKVDFGAGIVPGFAKTYVSAINNKLIAKGSGHTFDSDRMESYLNFLLLQRINKVNGVRVDFTVRYLNVPALYALTLTQVGKVVDSELGVELVPYVLEESFKGKICTLEEAHLFSKEIKLIEDLGFELVVGLPRDGLGSREFMFFQVTGDLITRHNKDVHSGYAILAAFFEMKQLESVLAYRVSYGSVYEYQNMLDSLIMNNE